MSMSHEHDQEHEEHGYETPDSETTPPPAPLSDPLESLLRTDDGESGVVVSETAPQTSDSAKAEITEQTETTADETEALIAQATTLRKFEDLTLAEMFGQLLRSPFKTWNALSTIANSPARPSYNSDFTAPVIQVEMPKAQPKQQVSIFTPTLGRYVLYAAAILLAVFGNARYFNTTEEGILNAVSPMAGLPFLSAAFLLWLLAEVLFGGEPQTVAATIPAEFESKAQSDPIRSTALPALALGLALAVATFYLHTGGKFTLMGVFAWFTSIALVSWAFTSRSWKPWNWLVSLIDRIRRFPREQTTTFITLLLITLGGAYFRLSQLDTMLPEMTSDHVEKLLDSQRVANGEYDIFFANNGGREPFQMYAMALLATLPGINIDFGGLKLLAAIESIITIPVFWLLGREIMGRDRPVLGNTVGLALAALLAVGYWHVAITRVALRIILTPLVTALLLIFLARGMRDNRRADFVLAGLVLGFGLYTYQAVRMLPVVVIVSLLLIWLFRPKLRLGYTLNIVVLVLVSFVVFVPMFRYSVEFPQYFWMRTSGRLFGDDVITETRADGAIVERNPTLEERWNAFAANSPKLRDNIFKAIGMFNYRGDLAWFHNAPNYPAMDVVTGALLIVGLAGWLVLIVRTRDPVFVLIPLALLVMLLPSALSVANVEENPSHTRSSGAMPMAYLLAAYGLAVFSGIRPESIYTRRAAPALRSIVVILVLAAVAVYPFTSGRVFGAYKKDYTRSWKPLSDGGRFLRGFALSDGAYGNAFLLAYPHWWDYRAVSIEAGLPPGDWHNGDIELKDLPQYMDEARFRSQNDYPLDVNRDIIVMYPYDTNTEADEQIEAQLREWFPEGYAHISPTYRQDVSFRVFRIPAPGEERFNQFVAQYAASTP